MTSAVHTGIAAGITGALVWLGLSYLLGGIVDLLGAVIFGITFSIVWILLSGSRRCRYCQPPRR